MTATARLLLLIGFLSALALPLAGQHSVVVPGWKKPEDSFHVRQGSHVRLITKDKRDLKGTVQHVTKSHIRLEEESVEVKEVQFARTYKFDQAKRKRIKTQLIIISPLLLALALIGVVILLIILLILGLTIQAIITGEKFWGP